MTLPAWVGAAWVTITPISDSALEGDENVVLTIRDSSAYTGGGGSATLIIHDAAPPNQRPTITVIPDQTVAAGETTGTLTFNIGDAETSPSNLQVSASSADEAIIPNQNLILGGSGSDRTITVASVAGKLGTAKITVAVSDGDLAGSQSFFVTVIAPNQAPLAESQAVTLPENGQVAVTLGGSDPEGSALTYSIVTNPAHGVLSGTAPSLIYTPNNNVSGSDSFTFQVNDGVLSSAPATVTITIIPGNKVSHRFRYHNEYFKRCSCGD